MEILEGRKKLFLNCIFLNHKKELIAPSGGGVLSPTFSFPPVGIIIMRTSRNRKFHSKKQYGRNVIFFIYY